MFLCVGLSCGGLAKLNMLPITLIPHVLHQSLTSIPQVLGQEVFHRHGNPGPPFLWIANITQTLVPKTDARQHKARFGRGFLGFGVQVKLVTSVVDGNELDSELEFSI